LCPNERARECGVSVCVESLGQPGVMIGYLNAKGTEQDEALAKWLPNSPPDIIISDINVVALEDVTDDYNSTSIGSPPPPPHFSSENAQCNNNTNLHVMTRAYCAI
jgi:hypothetical protein